MSGNQWKEMCEQLKVLMKKEVFFMRELLANMHQEELHLLLDDIQAGEPLIKERLQLSESLSHLKNARLETLQKLTDLIPSSKKEKSLERFLALDAEGYSEIVLLQDQLSALLERTDFQQKRNDYLQQARHQLAINPTSSYNPVFRLHTTQPKKKSAVITCEKYEN